MIFASDFILWILCQSLQYALLVLCAGDRLCHPTAPSARRCQAIFSSSKQLMALLSISLWWAVLKLPSLLTLWVLDAQCWENRVPLNWNPGKSKNFWVPEVAAISVAMQTSMQTRILEIQLLAVRCGQECPPHGQHCYLGRTCDRIWIWVPWRMVLIGHIVF